MILLFWIIWIYGIKLAKKKRVHKKKRFLTVIIIYFFRYLSPVEIKWNDADQRNIKINCVFVFVSFFFGNFVHFTFFSFFCWNILESEYLKRQKKNYHEIGFLFHSSWPIHYSTTWRIKMNEKISNLLFAYDNSCECEFIRYLTRSLQIIVSYFKWSY